jgi:hypothetical protein
MLQALVWMRHFAVKGHISAEKGFAFLYFPDTDPGRFVDLMLKKNRHSRMGSLHEVRYLSLFKKIESTPQL